MMKRDDVGKAALHSWVSAEGGGGGVRNPGVCAFGERWADTCPGVCEQQTGSHSVA